MKNKCHRGFSVYYLCPLDHQELKRDNCKILIHCVHIHMIENCLASNEQYVSYNKKHIETRLLVPRHLTVIDEVWSVERGHNIKYFVSGTLCLQKRYLTCKECDPFQTINLLWVHRWGFPYYNLTTTQSLPGDEWSTSGGLSRGNYSQCPLKMYNLLNIISINIMSISYPNYYNAG